MARGRFITLEGGEGAGKSTHIRHLAAWLQQRGIEVVTTREPGGTEGAETIRSLIVEGSVDRWDAVTETLLLNAARHDHITRLIRPALERGAWVLCDRYVDSTLVYQGTAKGVALETLLQLHTLSTGPLWPDLTLVLDLPPEIGLARAAGRHGIETRFEAHDIRFHEALRQGFLDLAHRFADRCAVVDASTPVADVSAAIEAVVSKRLGL
ncbi:dTMP kinase [Pedomonas mirosovicensis]|uniref:dTMP kinase n=1 Tax=Pedomonas mirosovicensis TaxID=2908641 RepID=UPI002168A1D6|nr:dTMP kinase [Pedomonas mirosovicensis]MCH8685270.1 dTMP kinase [Pedomonas mirosovicensis]